MNIEVEDIVQDALEAAMYDLSKLELDWETVYNDLWPWLDFRDEWKNYAGEED